MKIPPSYQITTEIIELVSRIEANRLFLISLNIPDNIKNKIQRTSLLKSSLYSARIEGNPLTLLEMENPGKTQKKQEVFNISQAVSFIGNTIKPGNNLDKKIILALHKIVLQDIFPEAGRFRKEVSAIFNQAGIAVYLTPPPSQISLLFEQLLNFINGDREKFPIIRAFVSHLIFEKIHPFLDGNGRVGRLLIFAICKAQNWEFNLAIPFEEYLDEHKDEYYFHLDQGLKKTNDYLLFMLKAFYEETEKIKEEVKRELEQKQPINLPPRQEEIYYIVKDHQNVSLDFLKRRFMAVPERTLRYDLKKLQEIGLIVKVGKTRGSLYRVKE